MKKDNSYITESGYEVMETIGGLYVTENSEYVCEIPSKTISDFTYNDKVDDNKLESEIESMKEVEEFINYQKDYC